MEFGSGKNIEISQNYIYLNSSALSELSIPSNLTLKNVNASNLTYPTILKDGVECDNCTLYTSIYANPIIFGIVSFSNYSVGEGVIPVTERDIFRDDIIGVLSKTALILGILIIVIFAQFVLIKIVMKDNELGSGISVDFTNTIAIIIGALILISIAIFVIAQLLA
jgi:hypothetical protein